MKTVKWFLLLFCFCYSVLTNAQVQLSFNPETGKVYSYVSNTDVNMKMNMMGQDMLINTNIVLEYDLQVKSKTAGEIAAQFVYKRFSMNLSMPMASVKIDTKNPNPDPKPEEQVLVKTFAGLLDKPIDVVFASDGSIKSVTGMNALVLSLSNSLPSGYQSGQYASSILTSMNDENIKKTFEQSFRIYPAQKVKIGDSWTIDMQANLSVITDGDIKNTYTLKSIQGNQATLGVASIVSIGKISGMEVSINGAQSGDMILNLNTGLPATSDMTTIMSGNLKVQDSTFGVNLSSKTTLSLK